MKDLKLGDELYCTSHGDITGLVTIKRLTKTQAITDNNIRFKIQQYSEIISSIGCGSYNTIFYQKRTLKLDNQHKKDILVRKFKYIDWSKYDLEKLEDLNTFL
tara:strand:- start:247 stop:555 length:309 start_codon:yes stop_codon:yes gene_type:complete